MPDFGVLYQLEIVRGDEADVVGDGVVDEAGEEFGFEEAVMGVAECLIVGLERRGSELRTQRLSR